MTGQTVRLKENLSKMKELPNMEAMLEVKKEAREAKEFTNVLALRTRKALENLNDDIRSIIRMFELDTETQNAKLLCEITTINHKITNLIVDNPRLGPSCNTCGERHPSDYIVCPYDPDKILGEPFQKAQHHRYKNTASFRNGKWSHTTGDQTKSTQTERKSPNGYPSQKMDAESNTSVKRSSGNAMDAEHPQSAKGRPTAFEAAVKKHRNQQSSLFGWVKPTPNSQH